MTQYAQLFTALSAPFGRNEIKTRKQAGRDFPYITARTVPHECRESRTCRCRQDADEPNEKCPVHGWATFPPRCGKCGRFLSRKSKEASSVAD